MRLGLRQLLLVVLLTPLEAQDDRVRYIRSIPRTLFETDPPNELCLYGFLGGVEKTMNADAGSSLTILSQVRLENIFRWLGLIPGRVTLEHKNVTALSHGPTVNATTAPTRAQNVTKGDNALFTGLEDIQESMADFKDALRSDNLTIASRQPIAANVGSLVSASQRSSLLSNPAAPWKKLVNSHFIEALLRGLVSNVTASGLGFVLESPMLNLGDVICQASEWAKVGDSEWNQYSCTAVTAVGEAVGCANSPGPTCVVEIVSNDTIPDEARCNSMKGDVLDVTLGEYEAGSQVPDREGLIAYYLMRAIWDFQQFASRGGLCGLSYATKNIVPGWHSILEVSIAEPGVRALQETNNTVIKTALMLTKGDDDYIVIIRGTSNDYEWNKNFRTQLVTLGDGYGNVHSGMYELSRSILPDILGVLKERARTQPTNKIRVTVSGHSLGGGIANVLGLLLLQESQKNMKDQLDIQVVGLASPRSLDGAATEVLKNGANVRNWLAELDVVPELPCAKSIGFPRCDSRNAFGAHGEGTDFYVDQLNPVMIFTKDLTLLNPKFGAKSWGLVKIDFAIGGGIKLNTASLEIPAPLQIPAYHLCSYTCYLSYAYCLTDEERLNGDNGWMCDECPWITG